MDSIIYPIHYMVKRVLDYFKNTLKIFIRECGTTCQNCSMNCSNVSSMHQFGASSPQLIFVTETPQMLKKMVI